MAAEKLLSASILATGVLCSMPVMAQGDSGGLEEVIVTAQKREERLSDVPLSITAVTGEQLTQQGITDVSQLEKIVPGFSYQPSWTGAPILSIRGIGFFDNAVGANPAVTTYIDQVPLPFPVMTRGVTFDVQRVEVLKGPQGTVFGQNSTGGAINFIAAKPTEAVSAGFDLEGGRFDTLNGQAFASGALTSKLKARVAGRVETRSDWQKGYPANDAQFGKVGVDELGERNFYTGRILLDWEPIERVQLEFGVNGWKDKSDTQAPRYLEFRGTDPLDPFNAGTYATFAGLTPLPDDNRLAGWDPGKDFARDDDLHQFSLRGDVELTDAITLTSISAYTRYNEDSLTEMDGTAYEVGTAHVLGDIRSIYQELRLAGEVGRLNWMIGSNYAQDEIEEIQTYQLTHGSNQGAGPFRWNGTEFRNDQDVDTLAGFGSLDYALTDALTIHGSVRYTDQKRDYEGCMADPGDNSLASVFGILFGIPTSAGGCLTQTSPGVLPPFITDSLDEDNVSWRSSLSWKPVPDAMLYATVSKGYKAGNYSQLPAIFATQLEPARQESVLAYEAGFKLAAMNRTLQLTGAAFYYDYKDKQITGFVVIPFFNALPRLQNIPESRVYGAELEATSRPIDGLVLTGGITYVNSEIQENPDPAFDSFENPANFVGEQFPNTPEWQGVADAQYTFPVSPRLNMFLGGSVTWRSDTPATLGNSNASQFGIPEFEIPSYTLLDLRAGIESSDESWRVQVWGRNVTDKEYRIGHYRQVDSVVDLVGMPATYGVTLTYRYH